MKTLIIAALCGLWAGSASAATYRVDVTTEFSELRLFNDIYEDYETERLNTITDEAVLVELGMDQWVGTGFAILETDDPTASISSRHFSVIEKNGPFLTLWYDETYSRDLSQGMRSTETWFETTFTPTNMLFRSDDDYSFFFEGKRYSGHGIDLEATVTDYRVTELSPVPLPAGALLLLTGVGVLGLRRKRTRQAA